MRGESSRGVATMDDLVKESRLVEDYEIAFEGERDGTEIWGLRLTPKPDAPVVRKTSSTAFARRISCRYGLVGHGRRQYLLLRAGHGIPV